MLILFVVTALPTKLFKIMSDLNLGLGPNTVAGLKINTLKLLFANFDTFFQHQILL